MWFNVLIGKTFTTLLGGGRRAKGFGVKVAFLCAVFCGLVSLSHAGPPVKTAYWIAQHDRAPLDEMQSGEFIPFSGVFNLGFQRDPVWVSLTVENLQAGQPYFLLLRPSLLERVDFFELVSTAGGDPVLMPLNLASSSKSDRIGLPDRSAMLFARESLSGVYLARVQTRGLLLGALELLTEEAYIAEQSNLSVQLGVFLGLSLTLFLFVFFVGSGMPSRFVGLFLAFQSVLVTLVASMNYLLAPWLRALGLDIGFSFRLFFPFAMICTGLFNIALLRFFAAAATAVRVQIGLFTFYLVLLLLQIAFTGNGYGRLSIGFFALHCLVSFVTLFTLTFRQSSYKIAILLAYFTLLLLSCSGIAVGWLLWAPGEWIFQWPVLVVSTLSLLMFITVIYELNLLRSDREDVKTLLALEQQKRELEQTTNEQNSKLLSMLSHEFKNSLAIINMELAVLREKGFNLRHAQKAIDDLLSIIERCMLLEKTAQRLVQTSIEPVNCHEMVDAIKRTHWGRAQIMFDGSEDLFVFADESVLRIVLTNLIDNAVKYGAGGKPVRLKVTEPPSEAGQAERIEIDVINVVGDCGKPDPAKVFTKYYRAPSVISLSGSGLGLYLVDTLCKLMQATVRFNDSGETIAFTLNLPKAVGLDGIKD